MEESGTRFPPKKGDATRRRRFGDYGGDEKKQNDEGNVRCSRKGLRFAVAMRELNVLKMKRSTIRGRGHEILRTESLSVRIQTEC